MRVPALSQPHSSFSAPFAFDIKNPEKDPCKNLQGHKHHIPKLDSNRLGTTISGNNHFGLKERKCMLYSHRHLQKSKNQAKLLQDNGLETLWIHAHIVQTASTLQQHLQVVLGARQSVLVSSEICGADLRHYPNPYGWLRETID